MSKLTKGTRGAAHAKTDKVTRAEQARRLLAIHGASTRRELSEHGGLEIATLCAALNKLERDGVVWVPYTITCKTTGHEVSVYQLVQQDAKGQYYVAPKGTA